MTLIHKLIFKALLNIYLLLTFCKNIGMLLLTSVHRVYRYPSDDPQTFCADLEKLSKKPRTVTLVVQSVGDIEICTGKLRNFVRIISKAIPECVVNVFTVQQPSLKGSLLEPVTFISPADFSVVDAQFRPDIPLVVCFCDYPTVCSLPYMYLVNAEIAFNPPLDKCSGYDLLNNFQQYSLAEQRRGK